MKKCPFCGEEIQDDGIKCEHCGELLSENRLELPKSSINSRLQKWMKESPWYVVFGVEYAVFVTVLLVLVFISFGGGKVREQPQPKAVRDISHYHYHREDENLKKAKKTLNNKDSIPSWAVHLETYKDKDNAYKRRDMLRKKGYEVIVKEVEIPQKGTWYRIAISGFKGKQDAYRKKEEIKKDFPGVWVAGPR